MKRCAICILLMILISLTACGQNRDAGSSANADIQASGPNYEALYLDYVNTVLIPEKGAGKEMDYPLSRLGAPSQEYISTLVPYVDGLCSVYLKDFNGDTIPEMVTVEIEKQFPEFSQSNSYKWSVYVDLYAFENETVSYKERIYETEKFRNADERIYVYSVEVNHAPALCITENFIDGPTGSSVFGDKFKMYTIAADNMAAVEQDILYYYNCGNSHYTYNGEEYLLSVNGVETENGRTAQSMIRDVFDKIGLGEFNRESGTNYCRFPEVTAHDKIFSCGTEQHEEDGRIFLENYTAWIELEKFSDEAEASAPNQSVAAEETISTDPFLVEEAASAPSAQPFAVPDAAVELLNSTLETLYGEVPAPAGTYQGTQYYAPPQYPGWVVHFPFSANRTDPAVLVECEIGTLFPNKSVCTYQELKNIFGDALGEVGYIEMGPGSYSTSVEWDGYRIGFEAFENDRFEKCSISKMK